MKGDDGMTDLAWPEAPACHADERHCGPESDAWRADGGVRTCSYCGSLHPGDLYELLRDVPYEPQPVYKMPAGTTTLDEYQAYERDYSAKVRAWRGLEHADWKYGWPHKFYIHGLSGARHAKWYNRHLIDLEGAEFTALAGVIARHSGLMFDISEAPTRIAWHHVERIAPERTDLALARILAAGFPARLRLDYNARDRTGRTRARFADCDRIPAIGEQVIVYQPEDGTEGAATVTGIDEGRGYVFLEVDWPSLGDAR